MSSGLEGVEAVKDQPVHVVLTDLQMPGIDGLETIDRISQNRLQNYCDCHDRVWDDRLRRAGDESRRV
jgi:CheY-like chemotaxis protein